ncbi:kinase-like domain-containing protein [Rhizophagus irregularis DAOM 181602=DAOM 197198]|nr:kinase-like domain-containing protein [Rhizophagus irregularis DAOM 181602=DAOM 197198]
MSLFGICEECNQENTGSNWCKACNAKRFQQNFENWTSALKSLNNSENVKLEFINEIKLHNKIGRETFVVIAYGITQDPETKNYIMVLEYAENGSLRNYLIKSYSELNWENKLQYLANIASGLLKIHKNELTHRDLHIGNVLISDIAIITDMGEKFSESLQIDISQLKISDADETKSGEEMIE